MTIPHKCYIAAVSQVSCQPPLSTEWWDAPLRYEQRYARAVEPDIKALISPAEARRMSRILKRATATSADVIARSGIAMPDAIITGTGMGCMENSQKFLTDICNFGESCLKPTLFMQSTHNTISALMAISLKCHGYNNTYSQKGISFESALLDAWLQMRGGSISSALVTAHDEVTPLTEQVMRHSHPEYEFISEASVATMLSTSPSHGALCTVDDVRLYYSGGDAKIAARLSAETDSILLMGLNGNDLNDAPYLRLLKRLNFTPTVLKYRHIFGDNFSSSALGFYTAVMILQSNAIPDWALHDGNHPSAPIRHITIIHHCDDKCWAIIKLNGELRMEN